MTQENPIRICKLAFESCEIHNNGNIYPCCPAYCKNYKYGNLNEEKTFLEIWNSDKAKYFRESMLNKDFSLCDLSICKFNPIVIDKNDFINVTMPKNIKMCWDKECNVACITCRNKIRRNDECELEKLKIYENKILPNVKYLKEITVSGSGDPFGSRYCQEFIKKALIINPNLIFNIHTNGLLCNENMIKKLGIYDKLGLVQVSIHASSKKTYDKIVKFSNFNQILKNLSWLSKMKKEGKITKLILIFVVNNYNYLEMHKFVKLADKYGAITFFSLCRDWRTEYTHNLSKNAIWDPKHPMHWKFLQEINKPDVKNQRVKKERNIINLYTPDIKNKIKQLRTEYMLNVLKAKLQKVSDIIRKIKQSFNILRYYY